MSDIANPQVKQVMQLLASGVLNETAVRAALERLGQSEAQITALLANAGNIAVSGVVGSNPIEGSDNKLLANAGNIAVSGSELSGGDGSVVASSAGRDINTGTVVYAAAGTTVVVGGADAPIEMTAVERQSALGRYLQHLIGRCRYLQLQGIRAGGRLVSIELDQIYITLRATRQRAVSAADSFLANEAGLAPGERHRRAGQMTTETVTVSVNEALAASQRLVVLGDPGSGKTTLLRYLALTYARDIAETERRQVEAGLGLAESGRLPILLELRRIGRYLAQRRPNDDGTDGHALLLDFLHEALRSDKIKLPTDFFDAWLAEGRAVILLDGLDEVADPDQRRRVARLVEAFARAYPACRWVVTSRVVGYSGPARLGDDFAATTVRDFTLAEVERFLSHWHRLLAVGLHGPGPIAENYAAAQTGQLLAAIRGNERIRELAINPLLLTVIAMVHRDRVRLPDRRAELYAEAVDVLLGKWDEARGVVEFSILPDQPFDAGDKKLVLQNLALHLQEQQSKEMAVGDLRPWLEQQFTGAVTRRRDLAGVIDRFLRVIAERAGLLAARGEGVYAFSHLTFQEYLAALAAANRDDYVDYLLARNGDAWWREVILLAADCLRDVGGNRVEGDLPGEIQRRLRQGVEKPAPLITRWFKSLGAKSWVEQRSRAMAALVRAGAGYWTLPYGEPEWVEIPAGEFWLGGDGEFDGKPIHRLHLPAFQIARTPITNAQYHLFTQATGYRTPGHWEEKRPPKGWESHPVVKVTWDDALAYCAWLSEQTGKQITLPSEAEWEKAARGDKDKRAYPWGDTWEATRCNNTELGLNATTPVGIFPNGASPYGCLDMAGNVWEWTRSARKNYPYNPDDDREDLKRTDVRRVLRGGAFNYSGGGVRCACRYFDLPDLRNYDLGFRVVVSPLF